MVSKNNFIHDSIHGSIFITTFEKDIISDVIFNRLHNISQNSTVYLTFPSNRTKRFEHSLGTMHVCSNIFVNAFKNTDKDVIDCFLSLFKKEVQDIINDKAKMKEYQTKVAGQTSLLGIDIPIAPEESPLVYHTHLNDDYKKIYIILLQSLRIAALLHDIGHPPFSHVAEKALVEINKIILNDEGSYNKKKIDDFKKITQNYFEHDGSKSQLHEQLGIYMASTVIKNSIEDLKNLESTKEKSKLQLFKILVSEIVIKIFNNERPFDILHSIIDGSLDGDRLDYVTRDPINSGMDRGKIEYDRIYANVTIAKTNSEFNKDKILNEKIYSFCPNIKSMNTIEDFFNRRWDMYKNIIFHHRVIKTDYLLQNVITELSLRFLKNDDEYQEDIVLPFNISGLWMSLNKNNSDIDAGHIISQWDDAWLLTVLKNYYFLNRKNEMDKKLYSKMEELLTNKKHYIPLIKRFEDFLLLDKKISKNIIEQESKIKEQDNENYNRILTRAKRNYKNYEKKTNSQYDECIFNFIQKTIQKINLADYIECICKDFLNSDSNYDNIITEIICTHKKYDVGLKNPLYLYNDKLKETISIHKVSTLERILTHAYDNSPKLYIYVLKKEGTTDDMNVDDLFNRISQKFVNEYFNLVEK